MADQVNIAGAVGGNPNFSQLDNVVLDVFSQEILFSAQPRLRFESIVQRRTELGRMPGHTITFLKYNSLQGNENLTEQDQISKVPMSTDTIPITVTEHGLGVSVSEFLLRTSITNTLDDAAILLGQHYAKNRDKLIRDTLLGNTETLFARQKADRASLVSADTFDVDLVRDLVEHLASKKAPKFDLDAYVTFIHPHQAKFLRKDSAWVNAQLYTNGENIKNGEIGRIEDVRFVETTQVQFVTQNSGTPSDIDIYSDGVLDKTMTPASPTLIPAAGVEVYRSIAVGDYAVGMAEALPVEMRDDGVTDFGRQHSIAYYGIWGTGLIETGHSAILETA